MAIDYAFYIRPCIGERRSGDAVAISRQNDFLFVAIIDVLGHGDEAHILGRQMKSFLLENWTLDVGETMTTLHNTFKGSRGAAAGLSVINTKTCDVIFTGVGNTEFIKIGERRQRLHSLEGIIGQHIRKPVTETMSFHRSDVLLYYTDGIQEHIDLSDYPQLRYENASTISQHVVSHFGKYYDDATCIALRIKDD